MLKNLRRGRRWSEIKVRASAGAAFRLRQGFGRDKRFRRREGVILKSRKEELRIRKRPAMLKAEIGRGRQVTSHNIGKGSFDVGGGNSRSKAARSSLASLISIDRALSHTWASLLAFGMAMTPGWRSTHASAICAGVKSWRLAIFFNVALFNKPLPWPTGE